MGHYPALLAVQPETRQLQVPFIAMFYLSHARRWATMEAFVSAGGMLTLAGKTRRAGALIARPLCPSSVFSCVSPSLISGPCPPSLNPACGDTTFPAPHDHRSLVFSVAQGWCCRTTCTCDPRRSVASSASLRPRSSIGSHRARRCAEHAQPACFLLATRLSTAFGYAQPK